MKKKPLLLKKKPLLFLMFFCSLMFLVICRLDASASETLKELSFTTPTQNVAEYASITTDFGLAKEWVEDTNKYSVTVNITPIYNSIWIHSGSKKINLMNLVEKSEILNRINDKTEISNLANSDLLTPVYDNDGTVSSFSQSCSIKSYDLENLVFSVRLPRDFILKTILSECGYSEDGEYLNVDSVQYSVQFKVKASISLKDGASPAVKLIKKSISGYDSEILNLVQIVDNQAGNYRIVKMKSSDSAIASVSSSNGDITLKKPGTCTITVTNAYGRSASFEVIVKESVISRQLSSVTCYLGTNMDLAAKGAVLLFGSPQYTVKSSDSSIVSVQKSGNHPIISGKKVGSAVLTFTYGSKNKKFSIRVKVSDPKIVLASSVTLKKGDSRTISANECADGIYIKKATSFNGLLFVDISSDGRSLTLTASESFSGTSVSEKVIVTFNNGKKKTIKVKITQPKPTPTPKTKKFSLKDVKIKLKRSYWNGSQACLTYTITNKSSKNLKHLKIFYSGMVDEDVSGYIYIDSSIPRGTSKTFTTKLDYFDFIDKAKLVLVSAS